MSTAVPLPPLHDLFARDEVARTAYARLLPLENQAGLAISILGQMLIPAPSLEGRTFVVKWINRCTTDQEIVKLAGFYLDQFVQYFRGVRKLSTPSYLPPDEIQVPTSHLEAKKQRLFFFLVDVRSYALVRDNYRCMLTGAVDYDAVESLPWLNGDAIATNVVLRETRCRYILAEEAPCNDVEEPSQQNTPNICSLAHLFGDTYESWLTKPGIHDPRNILTLEAGIHPLFREFSICLEPTGYAENQYSIVGSKAGHCIGLPKVVTFFSTSPDLPLPDPQYLAFHAAFARVIKSAGVRRFIIQVLREEEETKVFRRMGLQEDC